MSQLLTFIKNKHVTKMSQIQQIVNISHVILGHVVHGSKE